MDVIKLMKIIVFGKLVKWLFYTFMTLVFILMAISTLVRMKPIDEIPVIGGYKPLMVLGGSMEPAIKIGSIALIKHIDPFKIRPGDIITYRTSGQSGTNQTNKEPFTTHRVIKVHKNKRHLSFETKGDANKTPDATRVSENLVLGKVTLSLPYLAYPSRFARTLRGFILLVVTPGLLIISIEIRNIVTQIRLARSKNAVTSDQ